MTDLPDFVFARDGDAIIPNARSAGPWDPGLMHGGATAALAVRAAEQAPTPAPMEVSRLTIDLMRPAPIAPLTITREITREGRNIQVVAIKIAAAGKDVAHASVLKIRTASFDTPESANAPRADVPAPDTCRPLEEFGREGFGMNFDIRLARGEFRKGPSAAWFRLKRPLVEGEITTPAMRAAAIADFGNGISSVLNFGSFTFMNADVQVNLARAPQGDWVLIDGEMWIPPDGRGFAATKLADERSYFGRGHQNLVISAR